MSAFTRYLIICAICIGVYIASILTPAYDDAWFFAMQSLWSLLIIFTVLLIENSKLTFSIAFIECIAMILNLCAGVGYDDIYQNMTFFYDYYATMLNTLCIMELIILLRGAKSHGVGVRLERLRGYIVNRAANIRGTVQDIIGNFRKKEG